MPSVKISTALDKVQTYLNQARGSVGAPKFADMLNDLIACQRIIEDHAKDGTLHNVSQIQIVIAKLKNLLDPEK